MMSGPNQPLNLYDRREETTAADSEPRCVETYESIPRGVRIYGSSLSSLIIVPAIGKLYGDLCQFQTKVVGSLPRHLTGVAPDLSCLDGMQ